MNNKPGTFDFTAEVWLTKHLGGVEAAEALMALCQMTQDKLVVFMWADPLR